MILAGASAGTGLALPGHLGDLLMVAGHSVVSWASGGTIKKKSIKVIKSGLKTVEMHSNIIF